MNKRMINEARRPADVQHGRHKFKGLHYDKNGNPVYTHPSRLEDPDGGTLSDNDLKSQGWKYSKKHGLHGQISDPTSLPESKNMNKKPIQLTESDLHNIVENVVSNMLNGIGIGQQQQGQETQQPQQQQRQQPQQQQGQQQNNNQITAYQQALTNYLNKMSTFMSQQFQELNRNVSIIQQQIRALNQRTPSPNSNIQ